jgi:beta-lactamase regulating signal transducer with metallopeptidase domain/uncharacterized GH25 family protein/thiol-disulfide isomerase/thioredoxin
MSLEWFDYSQLSVTLFSIIVRSCLLLAITLAVAVLVRRRSAAVGHQVWILGFVGCLLIPLVMLCAPIVAVPLLPPVSELAQVARQQTAPEPLGPGEKSPQASPMPTVGTPHDVYNLGERDAGRREVVMQDAFQATEINGRQASDTNTTTPAADQRLEAQPWPSASGWLMIVWAVGAVLCGSRLLWQVWLVRLAARLCPPLQSESWQRLCAEVARELRVRQPISLRTHRETLTPMVVGFWRPTVLVPNDADKWSAEQQRHVLLHELAHVQRRDVLAQLVAGGVCVLYWFNPLAWWGAAQMRRLREIACDDVVVRCARRPSTYAQTLLDVARQYRCRQQAFSVTMARSTQVEGRICAILDATRERATLSNRNARIVAAAAVAILFVVATLQLTARAEGKAEGAKATEQTGTTQVEAGKQATSEPAEQAAKPVTSEPEDPGKLKKLTVRVRDESERPIADARVTASVWNLDPSDKRYPTRDYRTNAEGEVTVRIPARLRILRLWSSKARYVPLFVNFARGTHDDGQLIPANFEFRMPAGHRLSGVVVDDAGQPVSNARVQVRVDVNDRFTGPNPTAEISTWLASETGAVRTDKDGRWEIANAPAPREGSDYNFRLMVTHRDFAGDMKWGELQGKQGVTTQQLREGTAKITLDRGLAISGTITGPDGKPVTKGLVVYDDDPYYAEGVNEAPIDSQGKYKTRRLAAGEYPITVLAPGFAPEQRKVKLDGSLGPVDFQLAPGRTLKLKFVDAAGKPVPEAYVQIDQWRGTKAIFNHKHPNVPDSGIPRQADKDGNYTWTWAPVDGIGLNLYAPGFDYKTLTLVAKDEPHEVVMTAAPTMFGNVTDAKTGQPIEKFRAVPVKAFRPDFYSTDFQDSAIVEGRDGKYRIEFETYGETGNRYYTRIEAEGYRTAFSDKSLAAGDPPLELDFQLEPAPALRGVVVDQQGQAVKDFIVTVGTPTSASHFSFDRPDASFGIALHVEGTNEFRLPATFEPQRIRVFNDQGFTEVLRRPNEEIGTLTLQPTASISGRLVQDGEPLVGETIFCLPLANRGLKEARFQEGYTAKTDASGAFRFDRLPPGQFSIRPSLGPWQDSVMTSGESVPLDLKPGEHREITLGGGPTKLSGQVVAYGVNGDKLSKRWSLNYLISRDRGVEYPQDATPLGFKFEGPVQLNWLRQNDFQRWVATRENYFVKLAEDGRMVIHGVRPGEYDLVIQLYEQPAGCLVETIGEKVVPVTVDEGHAEGVVGWDAVTEQLKDVVYNKRAIFVPVQRGPRVGSDMRAYRFTDAEGQVRMINDLAGRYVLLDVWASWCEPCLTSMPELKSAVERYADRPLTVVGLNIDKSADADAARSLAKAGGWNWPQNYLGDDSDLMRQLGVSSVPAYYLIGPDGMLVGSANAWQQMGELLDTELRKASK